MDLATPLAKTLATTSRHLKALQEIGLTSVGDLLTYFPRTYADYRDVREVDAVEPGVINTVGGVIRNLRTVRTKFGKTLITARLVAQNTVSEKPTTDDLRLTTHDSQVNEITNSRNNELTISKHQTPNTDSANQEPRTISQELSLTWFNQAYITRVLMNGDEVIVTGKVQIGPRGRHAMIVNQFEKISEEMRHSARLAPVYRTHGKLITNKWLREKIFPLLDHAEKLPDELPSEIVARQKLSGFGNAVRQIHFPESWEEKEIARDRLAFDELFFLQLSALRRKLDWSAAADGAEGSGKVIVRDEALVREFMSKLPFEFTRAQTLVTAEILRDLEKTTPMNRLLEGDVGSGKTVVAALALFLVAKAGFQTALLAPTEILAAQHFRNFLNLLHPLGIRAELLTGSTSAKQKKEIGAKLKAGALDLVVGTHALLEETVQFRELGLVVIDEQHRFGVEQRMLIKKSGTPHLLSLTATPIPRTLALTIFGDQDVSIIDELPPGRVPAITRIVPPKKRMDAYRWIESEVAKGRQVFVVCPLIEENDALEVRSAKAEFNRLATEIFPRLTLGLIHGRMKPREKDAVMSAFAHGEIQILVATTVIEVGIDVANATIMLIEGAERFGLAQLHQLRGRVGRGAHQSYCFLFSESENAEVLERLHALIETSDGFRLAELDLKLRGPGEVFGTRQSGIPDLKLARLTDFDLIKRSRDEAEQLLAHDPELIGHPRIAERIAKEFKM